MRQPTVANTQDSREHVRSNVFLSAALVAGDVCLPVRIRNISTMGALLDGQSLPSEGAPVELRRGQLNAVGRIAWLQDKHCGIRFDNRIATEPWVRRVEHAGQRKVDVVVAAVRAGNVARVDQTFEMGSGLDDISAELSRINEELATLPNLTLDLAEKLIRLDVIAQRLRNWLSQDRSLACVRGASEQSS